LAEKNEELFKDIYSFKPYDWQKIVPESAHVSNVEYNGRERNRWRERYGNKENYILALVWQRKKKKREVMMKRLDLFKQKYLFFPICEQKHWSVAIVTNPGKAIERLTSNGLEQVNTTYIVFSTL